MQTCCCMYEEDTDIKIKMYYHKWILDGEISAIRCSHLDAWYEKNIVYANLIEEDTIASTCT